jgi:predicted MFS family arabinose efflux permease
LIAARILSGIFAGPSNALSIATLVDNVPVERRGRALGAVAGFQALAQIIGIPAGLQIAEISGSWRDPFFAMAIIAALLAITVLYNLKPQRAHLVGTTSLAVRERLRNLRMLLVKPICINAFAVQMTGIVPLVAITSIMAVFLLNNLGYPANELKMLYFIGGSANVLTAYFVGRATELGPVIVSVVSTILLTAAIVMGYMGLNPGLPLVVIFSLFFITSSARLVVGQSLTMRIPRPDERAAFQSLSQSIQSSSMGFSVIAIPVLLGSTKDGKLTGVIPFAMVVIAVTWLFPFLVYALSRMLKRRDGEVVQADAVAVPAE